MVHIANAQNRGKYSHAKTGTFNPTHPTKYIGKIAPIYKSQLEFLMMRYLDTNENILYWSYEPTSIKYFDRTKNKIRRYFIDFTCVAKVGSLRKTIWIEIKGKNETIPPKNKKNQQAMATYITNCCKWDAAKKLAESKGYEFHVITEDQLH